MQAPCWLIESMTKQAHLEGVEFDHWSKRQDLRFEPWAIEIIYVFPFDHAACVLSLRTRSKRESVDLHHASKARRNRYSGICLAVDVAL